MSANSNQKKTDVASYYQQAINGLNEYLANKTLVLNGKPVTSKAVVGLLQAQIDAMQASTAAHTAWLQAVAKERATEKGSISPLLAALRHYVAAVFGVNSDAYRAFGFQPPKPRVKSPQAKVIGAEKLRATRKARNTMGSRQRLAVTGAVPSAITLPTGSALAPAAASAPPAGAATVATPTNGATTTH